MFDEPRDISCIVDNQAIVILFISDMQGLLEA